MNINEENLNPSSDEGNKDNIKKHTTGGYSEMYAAGYSSNEDVVLEIRNASNNMGEELKKIAEKIELPTTQKKGYLNFGAGFQIIGKDYVFNAPSAFVSQSDYMGRELIVFSADCKDDFRKSPVTIEIARVKLPKKLTAQELKKRQKAGAKITGRKYKELVVNEAYASLVTENIENMPVVNRLSVLKKSGKEILNLIITIKNDIENYDEITKRIYFSFYFTEYGEYKENKK